MACSTRSARSSRTFTVLIGLSLFGLIGARSARAEEVRDTNILPRFELTPFLGYRLGGNLEIMGSSETVHASDHSVFGTELSMRLDEQSQCGLFYSRQSTTTHSIAGLGRVGLKVEYIHLDAMLTTEYHSLYPYLIGATGLTRLAVDAPETHDNTLFSIALGGGLRIPVRSNIAVRLEARAYMTFIDTNSSVFCSSGASGGACVLVARGSTFVQYDVLVGAAFAF
jgi:opacity protein-like surface antigen